MGGGNDCVVYGCSNYRRRQEKAVVMDHIGTFR